MIGGTPSSTSTPWHQNAAVMSALITSVFGLIGTVITLLVSRPDPAAADPTSAAAAAEPLANGPVDRMPGIATATTAVSVTETAPLHDVRQPSPNLLLNFNAFQSRLATPHIDLDERARVVRPLLGHPVIWKGYVDAVTPMADHPEWAVTVSLVESSEKTAQSMFKMPAHCRFRASDLETVSGLMPGDLVTISGTLSDHNVIATSVIDAHVVTINGRPVSQTASAPAAVNIR